MTQKHIINNFIHKEGVHCESSSLRDMFEYHGFSMSESMIFGLDATLGFIYFDKTLNFPNTENEIINTPIFIGGKQGTINPNSLACRLLGFTMNKQSFTCSDKAWEESKKLLDQNIPMILQVDLGYLPYINEEENEEIHFGGHTITLAGYDEEKGVAFIGDTDFSGLNEVLINDLKRARGSTEGPIYLHPKNSQYSMIQRPDGKHPPLAAGIKVAIEQVVNNMLRPSMNYLGIQGLRRFSKSILNWKEDLKGIVKSPYSGKNMALSEVTFQLIYGYIETWGTGGGAFRNLYRDFLKEILVLTEIKHGPHAWIDRDIQTIEDAIILITEIANNWTTFAKTLKYAADEYNEECINHVSIDDLHNLAYDICINEENLFKKLSKIKN